MKLSVLMPVYNEAPTLREAVRRVVSAPVATEIELVAVDDASTDGSGAIPDGLAAADPRLRVVRHDRNRGKAGAIRTALGLATGDLVLIQDADLEYDPHDYPALLAPLLEGKADAVFGSRFLGAPHRVFYFWHWVGNRFLTLLTNVLYDVILTDMETATRPSRGRWRRGWTCGRAASGSSRRSRRRCAGWGAASTRCPCRTAGGPTKRGRRSPGATGSPPSASSWRGGSGRSRPSRGSRPAGAEGLHDADR